MKYITSHELSEQWHISQRRIVRLAVDGKIAGAQLYGKSWVFPENVQKPVDGRTKSGKTENRNVDDFRFPLFEFKDPSTFNPPLTEDELTIKTFTEAYQAFRFKEAKSILGNLADRTTNRYIHIAALYCECMISIPFADATRFYEHYGMLIKELTEEFPHKIEMWEYLHEVDASLGRDEYYIGNFSINPTYHYHESFLPRLCNLSALRIALGNREITPTDLAPYELNCTFLEQTDNVFDLQAVHMYLACAYSQLNMNDECDYHFRKALNLAEKYNLFYAVASTQYYFTKKSLDRALEGFSEEFKQTIKRHNKEVNVFYSRFIDALQINNLYQFLASEDYLYIVFAVQGLSNKEIAAKMHSSVGSVGKRYGVLYAQFGIETKAELIALYRSMIQQPCEKQKTTATQASNTAIQHTDY